MQRRDDAMDEEDHKINIGSKSTILSKGSQFLYSYFCSADIPHYG